MLHLPTPKTNNHAQTYSNQSQSLYSYTRNSFNRSVAMSTTRITKKLTHTKHGDVTIHGLRVGYIQASPSYPKVSISLEWSHQYDDIVVRGTTSGGTKVSKRFTKISHARAYLKSFT